MLVYQRVPRIDISLISWEYSILYILVGGFKHEFYFPFHIWVVILPIDELHCFSRWLLHHQPDLFETNLGWAVLRFSRDNLFNLVAWTTARAMTGGTQGFSTNGMFEWHELICFHDCLAAAETWFFNIFHEVSEPYHNQWFSMIIISVFLELASTHSNTTNDHSLISFAKIIPWYYCYLLILLISFPTMIIFQLMVNIYGLPSGNLT